MAEIKEYEIEPGVIISKLDVKDGDTITVTIDTDKWDIIRATEMLYAYREIFPHNKIVGVLKGMEINVDSESSSNNKGDYNMKVKGKDFCTECRKETEYFLIKKGITEKINGMYYTFFITTAICSECGAEMSPPGLIDKNIKEIDEQYKAVERFVPNIV